MSVILHESWVGDVVAGWDCVRQLRQWRTLSCLNIIVKRWNFSTRNKYLALHFCCFSGIMFCKNVEYLYILQSANH